MPCNGIECARSYITRELGRCGIANHNASGITMLIRGTFDNSRRTPLRQG